ncbi:MAG: hypothetical protein ABII68_08945 [Pseudomonadota bacterium]
MKKKEWKPNLAGFRFCRHGSGHMSRRDENQSRVLWTRLFTLSWRSRKGQIRETIIKKKKADRRARGKPRLLLELSNNYFWLFLDYLFLLSVYKLPAHSPLVFLDTAPSILVSSTLFFPPYTSNGSHSTCLSLQY